jgi:hypothetical protein
VTSSTWCYRWNKWRQFWRSQLYIITCISAHSIRLAAILMIMSNITEINEKKVKSTEVPSWSWFSTTCATNAYHHYRCKFELCSWWGVFDTTLCEKVCLWLATGLWFSLGTPVSSTNKTDCHDTTEILLKVALNTINQT